MNDMIKMVVVLTLLSSVSGGLLAVARDQTKDRIENNQLEFVKGPAVRTIFEGSTNDPIADRFKIVDGTSERSFFVGIIDGKPKLAFETSGNGYGGAIGVMVGVDPASDSIVGVGITTHSETPGLGALAKTDATFKKQFEGMPLTGIFSLNKAGGQVDALSGATITSTGVAKALSEASELYARLKPQIVENMQAFSK